MKNNVKMIWAFCIFYLVEKRALLSKATSLWISSIPNPFLKRVACLAVSTFPLTGSFPSSSSSPL